MLVNSLWHLMGYCVSVVGRGYLLSNSLCVLGSKVVESHQEWKGGYRGGGSVDGKHLYRMCILEIIMYLNCVGMAWT